jgi:putative oxidoreductase
MVRSVLSEGALVAVVFGHAGDPFARRELPLLFLMVALMFALVGAGRYSVDRAIRGLH